MSSSTSQSPTVLTGIREKLARLIAPEPGDELTERWNTVTITPVTENEIKAFRVTGTNNPGTRPGNEFEATVDYVTVNGTEIILDEELTLTGGVSFEYYWSPEIASIDIHH